MLYGLNEPLWCVCYLFVFILHIPYSSDIFIIYVLFMFILYIFLILLIFNIILYISYSCLYYIFLILLILIPCLYYNWFQYLFGIRTSWTFVMSLIIIFGVLTKWKLTVKYYLIFMNIRNLYCVSSYPYWILPDTCICIRAT